MHNTLVVSMLYYQSVGLGFKFPPEKKFVSAPPAPHPANSAIKTCMYILYVMYVCTCMLYVLYAGTSGMYDYEIL